MSDPNESPEKVLVDRESVVAADSLLSWIWHRYLTPSEKESAGIQEYEKAISGLRAAYTPRKS